MNHTEVPDQRAALETLLVLSPTDMEAIEWRPVLGCPGVSEKELWRFGSYVQALIRVEPGAVMPGRPHLAAHHHLWLVSGTADVNGRPLTAGSYLHVPPHTDHRVVAGPDGCLLLQMHRPHQPQEAARVTGP